MRTKKPASNKLVAVLNEFNEVFVIDVHEMQEIDLSMMFHMLKVGHS